MTERFNVLTDIYQGPFELLLTLVERKKLHIHDIRLSEVAEDFIEYIHQHTSFPLDEIGEFTVTAATLLLIKSRALLPNLDLTQEETHSMSELEMRLKIYDLISKTRERLVFRFRMTGARSSLRALIVPKGKPKDLTPDALVVALGTVSRRHKEVVEPTARVTKKISLEEVVGKLEARIRSGALRFSSLKSSDRHEVVMNFLALLELLKQGILHATQENDGDIHIQHTATTTPQYG
jgi:segregation and condensation protein A